MIGRSSKKKIKLINSGLWREVVCLYYSSFDHPVTRKVAFAQIEKAAVKSRLRQEHGGLGRLRANQFDRLQKMHSLIAGHIAI